MVSTLDDIMKVLHRIGAILPTLATKAELACDLKAGAGPKPAPCHLPTAVKPARRPDCRWSPPLHW